MKAQPNWFRFFRVIAYIFAGTITIAAAIILALRFMEDPSEKSLPLDFGEPVKMRRPESRAGSYLTMRNIKFRMLEEMHMLVKTMDAEVIPLKGKVIDFDDINSFAIDIFQGEVKLDASVMEYVFNNIVFNYPDAPLRHTRISFIEVDRKGKKVWRLKSTGEMKYFVWIPFEMIGELKLDKKKLLLYLEAESIKSMGNPMTKQLLGMVGLNLEKMMKVPVDRGLLVSGNRIIIEPFKIFPPPRVGGYISEIQLGDNALTIKFSNSFHVKFPPLPVPDAKNWLYMYQGDVKFGKLTMNDARMMMIDTDPSDPFDFFMKKYFAALVRGVSEIKADGTVVAKLPDYE